MSSQNTDSVRIVTNTNFETPDNTISLDPVLPVYPSSIITRQSGGTAHILDAFRAKASFNVKEMTTFLDGGRKKSIKRQWIVGASDKTCAASRHHGSRAQLLRDHLAHFLAVHGDYLTSYVPTREEVGWMQEYAMMSGTMMNHYGLFLPTILMQADDEQKLRWLPAAMSLGMVGCYAQTELAHGSNVRGLRTVAVYDAATKTFTIDCPSLGSCKWWPGTLGKVATHALVYAQLIIAGVEYGAHAFMVQIRDEQHRPLPGVEVGDLGAKLGDQSNDTGFLRLRRVVVGRDALLARYQEVTPEGEYRKIAPRDEEDEEEAIPAQKDAKATGVAGAVLNSKPTRGQTEGGQGKEDAGAPRKRGNLHYATMLMARSAMIKQSGGVLARAATIAARYSCLRKQGFLDADALHVLADTVAAGQDDGRYTGRRTGNGVINGSGGAGSGCPYSSHPTLPHCPFSGTPARAEGQSPAATAAAAVEEIDPSLKEAGPAEPSVAAWAVVERRAAAEGTPAPTAALRAQVAAVNKLVAMSERSWVGATVPASAQITLHRAPEWPVAHYQVQRVRVLRQVANAYALKFVGQWMLERVGELEGGSVVAGLTRTDDLPEVAAAAAALKAYCTALAAAGIEDCRKCCGGVGYLLNSGVGALAVDYVWQVCAEGEATVMALTSARYVAELVLERVQAAARARSTGNSEVGLTASTSGLKGPLAYLAPLTMLPYADIIAQATQASHSPATATAGPLTGTSISAVLTTLAAALPSAIPSPLEQAPLFAADPRNPFARAGTAQPHVADAGVLGQPHVLLALCRQRSLSLWAALICSLLFEAGRDRERANRGASASGEQGAWVGEVAVGAAALNRCAVLAHEALQAHCVAIVVETYCAALARAPASLTPVLSRLLAMLVLSICSEHAQDVYRDLAAMHYAQQCTTGPVTSVTALLLPNTAVASAMLVRSALAATADALEEDMVALTDAFDIPDRVLNSTIGGYDGNAYERLWRAAAQSELNRSDPYEGYVSVMRPLEDRDELEEGRMKHKAML